MVQEFIEAERTIDRLEGIVYSGANKPNLLHAGKLMVERGSVVYPFIKRLVDQLSGYDLFDEKLAQDIVMAFCQACYVARMLVRISDRPSLQRQLNAMPQYSVRSQLARMPSSRYIESRMARRQTMQQNRQRVLRVR